MASPYCNAPAEFVVYPLPACPPRRAAVQEPKPRGPPRMALEDLQPSSVRFRRWRTGELQLETPTAILIPAIFNTMTTEIVQPDCNGVLMLIILTVVLIIVMHVHRERALGDDALGYSGNNYNTDACTTDHKGL